MKKRSVLKNYFYNVGYQIIAILIPIITTPYLSRVLGAINVGIYSYTVSITTYFILIGSLGVALYGQKEIAYVQDDIKTRTKKFYEIFFMKCITMIISLIIFYITFCISGKYNIYYSILIFEIIANIFDISWFFQGLEEFKKTVIRNMVIKILGLILIFVLIKREEDLKIYFWIYVLTNLIGNLSLWPYIKKYTQKICLKEINIKKHIKPCIILFVPQIAIQIYTVLDKTMIGSMVSDISEVAFYEQSQKIVKVILALITALGTVMLPRVSMYFSKKEYDKIKESIHNSFNFCTMFSIPLMFGIIVISNSLVPWFFGDEYEKAAIILQIISPIIVFISITNVIGTQYLLPVKKEKQYTLGVLSGAIINLIANFILIPFLKSIGAAIATDIAELIVLAVMVYCTRKEFDYKIIIKNIIKYFVLGFIMYVVCYIIGIFLKTSFKTMIIQGIVGIFIYIVLLIVTRDKFFERIYNRIKNKKNNT